MLNCICDGHGIWLGIEGASAQTRHPQVAIEPGLQQKPTNLPSWKKKSLKIKFLSSSSQIYPSTNRITKFLD